MKRKILSLMLVAALVLSLTVPALAAGQTFSDVPESYWGYADIEAVSKAGYMKGVGGGRFSPENKVTVAQFLTLLGRLVFPDVKTEGNDWYGPYVTAAQEAKLLDGTQVDTNNLEAEITRYDMAVILRAAAKKLGVAEKSAQSSEVTDYLDIPTRYAEAVLAVYGMGLIKGVGGGNFNGTGTMRRAEVATVIMRLARAVPGGIPSTTKPDSEKPVNPPEEDKLVSYEVWGYVSKVDHAIGRPRDNKETYLKGLPIKLYYTPDGGKTSTLVAETTAGDDSIAKYKMTFDAPESWGSMENFENGNGFYFSAETTLDGQRVVTCDLRTDGRAYKDIVRLVPGSNSIYNCRPLELTPPEGEKAHFTFQGHVLTQFDTEKWGGPMPGFTVQLHLPDGRIVGEAISQEDGSFSMECVVDALDGGFDNTAKDNYYVTASGFYKGSRYEDFGVYKEDGKLRLTSLWQLGMYDEYGRVRSNPDHKVYIYEGFLRES